jgi:alpha-ketoglutarate-dependent taurine dioxygenase
MNAMPVIEAGSFSAPVSFVKTIAEYESANQNNIEVSQVNTSVESTDGQVFLARTVAEAWPQLNDFGQQIAQTVKGEQGFVVIRGLNINGFDQRIRDALILSVVSAVGAPTDHNNDKRILWPVTPRVIQPGKKATFSEEAGEAPFHTDSAFSRHPERFISLFVVREAQDGGGQTVLLSGERVIDALSASRDGQECLEILRRTEFPFRVPDAFYAGEDVITAPVLSGDPLIRFRYDCIMSGFDLRPEMRTPEAVWAVEHFASFMRECDAAMTYRVARGEMIVSDNHRLLHSRTDFVDPNRLLIRVRMHQRAA